MIPSYRVQSLQSYEVSKFIAFFRSLSSAQKSGRMPEVTMCGCAAKGGSQLKQGVLLTTRSLPVLCAAVASA